MPKSLPNKSEFFILVSRDTVTIQQGQNERAGKIQSQTLANAICENYLGPKPVSPALRIAVWKEMRNQLS